MLKKKKKGNGGVSFIINILLVTLPVIYMYV